MSIHEIIDDVRLNKDEHFKSVGDFSCGMDQPLDTFLQSHSFSYDEECEGNTFLIMDKESKGVIGFYTLKCNAFQVRGNGEEKISSISTIELARFAINHNLQCKGWGTVIFCEVILPKIQKIKELAAVKCIMLFVEPDDRRVIKFYEELGFKIVDDEVQSYIEPFNEGCNLMCMSLKEAS